MSVAVVRRFARDELLRLADDITPEVLAHHRQRLAWQEEGRGLYLAAWGGDVVLGRVTLLWASKYPQVRERHPACCEVKALEASPAGRGVGGALMAAARDAALARRMPLLGVAVEPANLGARRFYKRLGYRDWGGGAVVEEWNEYAGTGGVVRHDSDRCHYLLLRSGAAATIGG